MFPLGVTVIAVFAFASVLSAAPVDFVRDVQPIFAEHCTECHGPEKQKSGYRLDVRDVAVNGGDSGEKTIIQGHSAESPLIRFVSGEDQDMAMPPKKSNKARLSPEQVALLRAWIDQGAPWPAALSAKVEDKQDWWSLKPISRPSLPETNADEAKWVRNPVDAFIITKLRKKGLSPAPEADRRTLIRRLYFDLIGLPPSPEEVAGFVSDTGPQAYEKLVDRLLASPRYGERWARHWLDVVHFGETHGYDKDKPRPNAWPYRDYIIRAFNDDKPYGRFVQEQIAGDALFPQTADGIEALGFIAAGPWDLIGHAEVPENKTDGKIARHLDRDDMVANTINTFCSLTVHCAQCHDHKFDPISQEDYYSLQAVFAALDRTERKYDADAAVASRRGALETRQATVDRRRKEITSAVAHRAGETLSTLERRIAELEKSKGAKSSNTAAFGYHSAISEQPDAPKWVQVDLGEPKAVSSVVLHPCKDDFNNIGEGFGFPVRFKVELSNDPEFGAGAVTVIADRTRKDVPNPRIASQIFSTDTQTARYVRVTATKLAPRMNDYIFALSELEVRDADGKNIAAGTTVTALDSIEAPVRWRKTNLVDGYYPGGGKSGDGELVALQAERTALLARIRTADEVAELEQLERESKAVTREITSLPPQRTAYIGAIHTGSGAFRGTGPDGGKPRVIKVLLRGDVKRPGKEVGPGAIVSIAALQGRFDFPSAAPESERRAALAHWLTDRANPLTWRSIVNRVWQYHFGRGIVDSPNDFGRMGQLPSHPELLDWLACEFRDGQQSLKQLHRLIATSATYRQSANVRNTTAETADAENRLLWRMNRRRLEAEAIRDSVLSVAGKLDLTMGGPSFQDFVITHPEHSPHYEYQLADPEDPKLHRRSIYRFLVRSQQQPWMAAMDCADPSMLVEKRNQTITPLQALAQLNNQLMVAMPKHFAARVDAGGGSPGDKIARAFQLALQREPTVEESDALSAFASEHGLVNACRLIINLNEFAFID
ncbi:DUF1553 domain-containing protein [Verrucomicrobiota bacterium sgz303538]